MKNTSKLLALVLALMMVLALTSCDISSVISGLFACKHVDADNDHICDRCEEVLSECADADKDHKCDLCGKALTECADADKDHKCDLCGKALTECADADKDHKCDLCGKVLTECADADKNHKCDICGRVVSVSLTGNGETLGMDGSAQPTAAELDLDLINNTATLTLTTEASGMSFALLDSVVVEDPMNPFKYMMCSIIGIGNITETEGGYKVSFAWSIESTDETTGETTTTPMSLDVVVSVSDGVYTASVDYFGIVVDVDSYVKLTGTGETLGMDGSAQPTAAELDLDLINNTATLTLTTEASGMSFALLDSVMVEDPTNPFKYMMCSIIGVGAVTETEGGYKVSFAWSIESTDETTGETTTTPMSLDVVVSVADGSYTASVDYFGIVVDVAN